MIDIINFSDWEVYDGCSEGSGRSEKIWLKSKEGQLGLFKFPKVDPECKKTTTEHISEHLAYRLGLILNVEIAKPDIGVYNGRIGSMSYSVCGDNVALKEGIEFISGKFPDYDAEKLLDKSTETYYCIDHIFNALPNGISNETIIEMMIFDFLIGNTDRHHSNWAFLVKTKVGKEFAMQLKQSPLYDNGSSLCCFVNDKLLSDMLDERQNRFNALVDTKSVSVIRIDGKNKKKPSHCEVVRYLLDNYSVAMDIAKRFVSKVDATKISELLTEYPEELLESRKGELIRHYLIRKIELLKELVEEVNINEEK